MIEPKIKDWPEFVPATPPPGWGQQCADAAFDRAIEGFLKFIGWILTFVFGLAVFIFGCWAAVRIVRWFWETSMF